MMYFFLFSYFAQPATHRIKAEELRHPHYYNITPLDLSVHYFLGQVICSKLQFTFIFSLTFPTDRTAILKTARVKFTLPQQRDIQCYSSFQCCRNPFLLVGTLDITSVYNPLRTKSLTLIFV